MRDEKIKFQTDIVINAKSEDVWAVISDLSNWKNWTALAGEGKGNVEQGADVSIQFNTPNGTLTFERKIITFDKGKVFGWTGDAFAGLKDYHHFWVETLEDGQTRFTQGDGFHGAEVEGIGQMEQQTLEAYKIVNQHLKDYVEANYPKVV